MVLCVLAAMISRPVVTLETQPVEDTYIDSQLPEMNFGHDPFLIGGPKSIVLVRFPGLEWIPDGQVPDTAVLTLHTTETSDVKLVSVKRFLVPWGEGSGLRLPMPHTNSEALLNGSATWASSRSGQSKWQSAGAAGDRDAVAVPGVSSLTEGDTVRIVGLGPVLADMAKRPSTNYGLRIEFASTVNFVSSDGPGSKPALSMTTKPAQAGGAHLVVTTVEPDGSDGWVASVVNTGDTPATGWHATWSFRGTQVDESSSQKAIAPGDTVRIQCKPGIKLDPVQPRRNVLTVAVDAGGQGGAMAERSVVANGLPVKFELSKSVREAVDGVRGTEPIDAYLQRVVACTNGAVLAQSKVSFSPDGCLERLRLAAPAESAVLVKADFAAQANVPVFDSLVQATVRSVSPLGGKWILPPEAPHWPDTSLGWVPDSRDDTMWQTAMTLPQFPWGVPKDLQPILPARGLLGRAEVAVLNAMVGKTVEARAAFVPNVPKALILALTDGGGLPIAGADVEVFQTTAAGLSTEAVYKKKSTSNGYVVLGSTDGKGPFADLSPDGSNSWYLVRVTREFVTETAWLPATNVIAEAARGNAAPTVELRLMMGSGEIKTDDDLAAGKFVTDSMGRFPAELTAVVDGDPSTSVEVTPGDKPYTLDIDLGRDRLIAAVEIETTGDLWDTFDISVSKTGQKGEFEPWFKEGAGAMRLAERGQAAGANKVVTYLATAVRARTLRLTVKSGNKVNLAAIRVRSLKQG